ncbi:hypothetical protein BOTNAR_0499g00100 [Botryotinia narcissicola]|uniref:Uncharacterized protein n=1 Tax=Botryotinia narcissicola TaxID=278944 RepID=A0A4Z1HT33_9HELO|nr:hypothetical protein BOTNAR_0499g00100 [Botryotinia narcissicola]
MVMRIMPAIFAAYRMSEEKRIREVLGWTAFTYQRTCGKVRTTKLLMTTTMNASHQLITKRIFAASADAYKKQCAIEFFQAVKLGSTWIAMRACATRGYQSDTELSSWWGCGVHMYVVGSAEGWWVERGLWGRKCFREMGMMFETRERLEI